jgi:hypothetical protein
MRLFFLAEAGAASSRAGAEFFSGERKRKRKRGSMMDADEL